jgi:predicted AAA+ superfamily ATPase
MTDDLIHIFKRLLTATDFKHRRYIYEKFNLNNRLSGIIGPRGTGKTTLMLQYIQEKIEDVDECFYASLDHIYFSKNHLTDLVNELYENYGIRFFFFDEVHKYPNWNQELKNIYDAYPDIKIVFSGSSSIDLIKESYDLSRRGVLYRLEGMSFREYLLFNEIADIPSIRLENLLNQRNAVEKSVTGIKRLKGHFKSYLRYGYYPFHLEDKITYHQKLLRVIEKTIFEDISHFYRLKTKNLYHFKRILSYLATLPPGELNRNSIAKHIGIDNKTVQHYLNILQETGLAELIRKNKCGSSLLKQTEKIYLDNPDMYAAIIDEIGYSSQLGTIREIFFIKMIKNSGNMIYYSANGDFEVNETLFEVGGKNKSLKQIKNKLKNAYLVKDDILFGSKYEIPLYLFGFLY